MHRELRFDPWDSACAGLRRRAAGRARTGRRPLRARRDPGSDAGEIAASAGLPYAEVAARVIAPFAEDSFPPDRLRAMTEAAYAGFRHPAVTPLSQLGDNLFVLELFHGPTLAFKDVAMQLLGRMMEEALGRRGQRTTIVGATSGDTGASAIEAFRGLPSVDLFILYPHGRVSDVQRRQMTGVDAPNVHAIALEGTFDDCQAIVKALFNHHAFRDELNLSGVNSINWARVVAQIAYYFVAGVALGAPHRKMSFAVPTGNFGDVLAGWMAKAHGPAGRTPRGRHQRERHPGPLPGIGHLRGPGRAPHPVALDGHPGLVELRAPAVCGLWPRRRGGPPAHGRPRPIRAGSRSAQAPLGRIRAEFDAFRIDEAATQAEMARAWRESGHDPRPRTRPSASARPARRSRPIPRPRSWCSAPPIRPSSPTRSSAPPGQRPPLPPHLADLLPKKEHFTVLPNDVVAIERFIRDHTGPRAAERDA